jgi:hypothetical protein
MESCDFPDASQQNPFHSSESVFHMNSFASSRRPCFQWPVSALWVLVLLFGWAGSGLADEAAEAEGAAQAMALPLEKKDFVFRAEAWVKELRPDVGKAIKVQLFKGNDYRFCVAVPPGSGVQITATVLDFEGKPGGKIRVVEGGWGAVVEYQPKKTGVYVVAIRQTEEGKPKSTVCAMVTGYK